jgi:hypothetical protein
MPEHRDSASRLKRSIELQSVPVRISNVKLASTPSGLHDRCDLLQDSCLAELSIDSVHISHDKTIGGAIANALPLLGVVPLKVQFHSVSLDPRVVRVFRGTSERERESQLLVEADRPG